MNKIGFCFCLMAGFMVVALATTANAQPAHGQPASALFFPVYDSGSSTDTLITVTNINDSRLSCGNGWVHGDVAVHYVYFEAAACSEFDTTEVLTPGDTLTVLASQHNPETEEGFLWVEARDPESGEAMNYNFLIGSAHVVKTGAGSADGDFLWAYTPYAFRSYVDSGTQSNCSSTGDAVNFWFTDVDSGGDADFDGNEYDKFPERLFLDNFFAEDGVGVQIDNMLYLMSANLGFTDITYLAWDNNENRSSLGRNISCWFGDALSSISNIFLEENLDDNADPLELVLPGGATVFTGWLEIIPQDGPLLGAFYSVKNGTDLGAGRELQYTGTWDGVAILRIN